jgi:hypothetical protein
MEDVGQVYYVANHWYICRIMLLEHWQLQHGITCLGSHHWTVEAKEKLLKRPRA